MVAIDFHSIFLFILYIFLAMIATDIFQSVIFCKETHTGFEEHKGEHDNYLIFGLLFCYIVN